MSTLPALWFSRTGCRPVVLRSVTPDDAGAFAEFVRTLSPLSRLRRFHVGLTELPSSWLDMLVRPQPSTDLALVAMASRDGQMRCVAEARYVADQSGHGAQREFALAVADEWQHEGLGTALLAQLSEQAAHRGVRRLVGDVLRDNQPMLRLAERQGFSTTRHPDEARLLQVVRDLPPVAPAFDRPTPRRPATVLPRPPVVVPAASR